MNKDNVKETGQDIVIPEDIQLRIKLYASKEYFGVMESAA